MVEVLAASVRAAQRESEAGPTVCGDRTRGFDAVRAGRIRRRVRARRGHTRCLVPRASVPCRVIVAFALPQTSTTRPSRKAELPGASPGRVRARPEGPEVTEGDSRHRDFEGPSGGFDGVPVGSPGSPFRNRWMRSLLSGMGAQPGGRTPSGRDLRCVRRSPWHRPRARSVRSSSRSPSRSACAFVVPTHLQGKPLGARPRSAGPAPKFPPNTAFRMHGDYEPAANALPCGRGARGAPVHARAPWRFRSRCARNLEQAGMHHDPRLQGTANALGISSWWTYDAVVENCDPASCGSQIVDDESAALRGPITWLWRLKGLEHRIDPRVFSSNSIGYRDARPRRPAHRGRSHATNTSDRHGSRSRGSRNRRSGGVLEMFGLGPGSRAT